MGEAVLLPVDPSLLGCTQVPLPFISGSPPQPPAGQILKGTGIQAEQMPWDVSKSWGDVWSHLLEFGDDPNWCPPMGSGPNCLSDPWSLPLTTA